ncbi:MAG: hypothetical protein VW907_05920, partial [Opitutae bacterium]
EWNIIETKPSPKYIPGTWNLLSVRFEQGGQIRCSINGEEIIKAVDFTLKDGWVGFCKFREPGAEFRNFRISPRLPPGSISPQIRQRAYELSQDLTPGIKNFLGISQGTCQNGCFRPASID